MTNDENYLRAVEFRYPEWIPFTPVIMPATWRKHRGSIEEIVLRHPVIFGRRKAGQKDFDETSGNYTEGEYTDAWGCGWKNLRGGLIGQVVHHPLADWSNFAGYHAPDPYADHDWNALEKSYGEAKQNGRLARASGGSLFHQLCFLRGFENLMLDIGTDSPALHALIRTVHDYNMAVTRRHLEIGANLVSYGDDLGTQRSLPMSPEHFRRYLGPCYAEMFGACRNAGAHVYLHTDGYLLDIIDNLIEYGVTILNPEEYPHGLDALAKACKGKVCVDLTFAQQRFPFLTPDGIWEYFGQAVAKLASPKGGLLWYVEIEPDVPLRNVEAICQAMEYHHRCVPAPEQSTGGAE